MFYGWPTDFLRTARSAPSRSGPSASRSDSRSDFFAPKWFGGRKSRSFLRRKLAFRNVTRKDSRSCSLSRSTFPCTAWSSKWHFFLQIRSSKIKTPPRKESFKFLFGNFDNYKVLITKFTFHCYSDIEIWHLLQAYAASYISENQTSALHLFLAYYISGVIFKM